MNYGIATSMLWKAYIHGDPLVMFILLLINMGSQTLELICLFIRYCEYSKGYVMYGEHHVGGLANVESCDVDLVEDDFPSIGEIKQILGLHELEEHQDSEF